MSREESVSQDAGLSRRRVLRGLAASGTVGATAVGTATAAGCDLEVHKARSSQFEYGGTGTFEIEVCNVGTSECASGFDQATLSDQLPNGLTFAGVESNSWGCQLQNGEVRCITSAAIQPGECLPVTVEVDVAPKSSYPDSPTTNCATASAPNDSNPDNDTGCTDVCLSDARTIVVGGKDNFSGTTAADPDDALEAWIVKNDYQSTPRKFDESGTNKRFGHTFDGLTADPNLGDVCGATLRVRARPDGEMDDNDTIKIGYYEFDGNGDPTPMNPGVKRYFGSGNGEPGLVTDEWSQSNYSGQTFSFDLSNVRRADGTTQNFLPAMNSRGTIDFFVQDDTAIDWAELELTYCCQ